ncbi:MAG: alpha/beta fold hydrolase [Patescibacteria group bacterium]
MREKSLDLPQGQIFYLTGGQGPPLLFLHGAIATPKAYQSLLDLLTRSFKVISPLHPGHGKSFSLPNSWQLTDFSNFYEDYLAKLKFKPEIIIGHSFGGTLALLLGSRGIGAKLVVMDAPALPFALTPGEYFKAMLEETRLLLKQKPDQEKLAKTARAAGTLVETVVKHPGDIPLLFREGPKLNISQELRKIKIPVAIFWGGKDKLVPLTVGQQMAALIPKSTLTIFSERGHNYPVMDPEFTSQALRKSLWSW